MNNKIKQASQTRNKVALGLNITIVVFIFLGFTFIFAKLYPTGLFSQYGLINLKFYSMIINIFALAMAITMIVYLVRLNNNKIKQIPKAIYVLDFVVAAGLTTNLVMLLGYLMPVCIITKSYDTEWLFTGPNMIFYLLVPLLFGCEFIFALPKSYIKFKHTFIGIVLPMLYFIIYSIIGLCNILHDNTINPTYDFYGFAYYGYGFVFLALFALLAISYGSSCLIWFANKKGFITKTIINLCLDVVILFMCVVVIIWLFWYPLHDEPIPVGLFVAKKFLYFTNWSIFILTIVITISLVYTVLEFLGKRQKKPEWLNILLLSATSLCAIVLFFELFIAAPTIFVKEGINRAWRLCFGHQLMLEHLMIPMVAIFTYIVVEHNNLKAKWIWCASVPLGLYALIYMIVLYANINNTWSKGVIWDVYGVLKYLNYKVIWLAPFIMYGINAFFTWVVWISNTNVNKSLTNQKTVNQNQIQK